MGRKKQKTSEPGSAPNNFPPPHMAGGIPPPPPPPPEGKTMETFKVTKYRYDPTSYR